MSRAAAAGLALARALHRRGRTGAAIAIWRFLAKAGVPRAQTNLGACLANGTGMPIDRVAAQAWLRRGAEAGDVLGQRNLAALLARDDPASALAWYRRAAEAGDAVSQDELSRRLLEGQGASADPAQARVWAEQAAGAGVAAAAARLGTMWHEAAGGPRDVAQAVHWWQIGALAGDADAAARLGAALHIGQGAAADQVEAMAWLLVASARRSALVRPFLARVRDGLDPAQIAAAETLARDRGWCSHPSGDAQASI